jgi:hypothetical protein
MTARCDLILPCDVLNKCLICLLLYVQRAAKSLPDCQKFMHSEINAAGCFYLLPVQKFISQPILLSYSSTLRRRKNQVEADGEALA